MSHATQSADPATGDADRYVPSTRQKVGLVLAGLYSLGNLVAVLFPTPEGETGPPLGIVIIGGALGLIGLVGVVLAWRGSRRMLRLAAIAVVVATLTALPAFFVDVSAGLKAFVALIVGLTVVMVILMFSAPRAHTEPVS